MRLEGELMQLGSDYMQAPMSNENTYPSDDKLLRIAGSLVEIGYALHPVHNWGMHIHDRHQFILTLSSDANAELSWVEVEKPIQSIQLSGRNICFIERNTTHAFRWNNKSPLLTLYITDPFIGQMTTTEMSWQGVHVNHSNEILHRDLLALNLVQLVEELCYYQEKLPDSYLRAIGVLLSAQLVRSPAQEKWSHNTGPGLAQQEKERLQTWIREHLHEKISLNDLARITCISKDHFGKKFKATFKLTPHKYILIERIQLAQALIKKGEMRLAEIAVACGFFDQSHMIRCMKPFCKRHMANER